MTRPKRLCCACCGDSTIGRQWFNRDTGYGVCAKCVDWQVGRGTTQEEIKSCYGVRGVHYDIPETPDFDHGVNPEYITS